MLCQYAWVNRRLPLQSVFRSGTTHPSLCFNYPALTQVDLRSATEVEQDELIHADIYRGFVNVGPPEQGTGVWEGPLWDVAMKEESNHRDDFMGTDTGKGGDSRRRYFVSLIDESIYKKGVFQRLRRRHKVRTLMLLLYCCDPCYHMRRVKPLRTASVFDADTFEAGLLPRKLLRGIDVY